MVCIDLGSGESSGKRWVPLLVSLIGVLAVSLFSLRPQAASPITNVSRVLRPLAQEEREAVIFDLQRLQSQAPELGLSAENLTIRLRSDQTSGLVDATQDKVGSPLVHSEKDALVFTPRFFSSDTGAQQEALRKTVVQLFPPNSLAVRTGEQ